MKTNLTAIHTLIAAETTYEGLARLCQDFAAVEGFEIRGTYGQLAEEHLGTDVGVVLARFTARSKRLDKLFLSGKMYRCQECGQDCGAECQTKNWDADSY